MRVLRWLLVAWALYLVVVNVALNVGVLPRAINRRPDKLQIGWSMALSPLPGYAWVRGFHLRVQGKSDQWDLHVERATVRVVLHALLHRRFHAAWVHASGVDFHFRPRLSPTEVTPESLAVYPAIPGLPSNLVPFEPGPPPGDPNDLWSVQLEQASVGDIREVWVGPYRAVLDFHVEGRFLLRPHQELQVGPLMLDIRGGNVFQGSPLPVLSPLAGRVSFAFAAKDWGEGPVPGALLLESLDATAKLRGKLASLRPLNYHLRGALHPEVEGGAADFELALGVDHGRLREGTKAHFVGAPWRGSLGTLFVGGGWHADLAVEERDAEGSGAHGHSTQTSVDLVAEPVWLGREAGPKLAQSPRLKVALSAWDVRLGAPLEAGQVTLELAPTRPISLHRLEALVGGSSMEIESGTAVVRASLQAGLGGKKGKGSLVVQTDRVWALWNKARVSGELSAAVDLNRVQLDRESASLAGTSLQLKDVAVFSPRGERQGWDGSVLLDSARVRLKPHLNAQAEVHGQFSDARPFLALAGGVPKLVTPLLAARNLQVHAKVHLAGGAVEATDLRADGDGLHIAGELTAERGATDGLLLCKVHGFSVGLDVKPGKVKPELLNPEAWFHRAMTARHGAGSDSASSAGTP